MNYSPSKWSEGNYPVTSYPFQYPVHIYFLQKPEVPLPNSKKSVIGQVLSPSHWDIHTEAQGSSVHISSSFNPS